MTHPNRSMRHWQSPHEPVGWNTRIRRNVLLAAALLTLGMVSGAEPPLEGSRTNVQDIILARAALAALDRAEELRGVNLVVSVADGVAVIGGPVPTLAHAQKAELIVRSVPGIRDVTNTCFVSSGPDPLLRAITRGQPPRSPQGDDLPAIVRPAPPVSPFPIQPTRSEPRSLGQQVVTSRRVPDPIGGQDVLGPPVAPIPGGSATPSTVRDVPAVAPGTLTGNARVSPLAAALAIQRSDPRYAGLKIDYRDQTIWISGMARQHRDAWDLAAQLRSLPGVARIVVGTVEITKP